MTTPPDRPKVGVSLLVVKNGARILLGKRLNPDGTIEYETPGGHMEFGESGEGAALRELHEECGPFIQITEPRFLCVSNSREYLPEHHYIDVAYLAHWMYDDAVVPEDERHKCGGWGWYSLDALPTPRFSTVDNMVIAYRTSQPYFA